LKPKCLEGLGGADILDVLAELAAAAVCDLVTSLYRDIPNGPVGDARLLCQIDVGELSMNNKSHKDDLNLPDNMYIPRSQGLGPLLSLPEWSLASLPVSSLSIS
jgi:hypothetical protein